MGKHFVLYSWHPASPAPSFLKIDPILPTTYPFEAHETKGVTVESSARSTVEREVPRTAIERPNLWGPCRQIQFSQKAVLSYRYLTWYQSTEKQRTRGLNNARILTATVASQN